MGERESLGLAALVTEGKQVRKVAKKAGLVGTETPETPEISPTAGIITDPVVAERLEAVLQS